MLFRSNDTATTEIYTLSLHDALPIWRHGPQRSFLNVMFDFASKSHGKQPDLQGTSFVIASREARAAMEADRDCGFTDQGHWLTDSWWPTAQGSNLLRLGNHSWDHVHPAPREIATKSTARGNFATVDNYEDANSEIRDAGRFIEAVSGAPCKYFAYPYGHTNDYLTQDYLPAHQSEHGLAAAFTTEGRRVRSSDSIWTIPRAVCGHHWRSPEELHNILFD